MVQRDIEKVLLSAEEIDRRVRELAGEVRAEVGNGEILALGVLTGAFVFLSDLIRRLGDPVCVSFVSATSYRDGTVPGELLIEGLSGVEVRGRDVLVVEDIVDTGRSLYALQAELRRREPRSLRTAVLLDKRSRRQVEARADFTGFVVPDEFLVGYGLDYAGRYRNLPYVGVLRRSVYEKAT
jgi:hypoxanthine phosphoribosyltransferase